MSDPNMDELSPAARALLDDARDLDGPTPADRDRNRRALVAALASGAGLAASTVASSTAAATTTAATATTAAAGGLSLGVKIAAVALVAVAVGGTALVVVPSEDPPAPRAAVEAPARARDPDILRPRPAPSASTPEVAAPVEPAPVDDALLPASEPVAQEAVEATPAPRVRHVPATRREIAVADSTLSEELVLLREAQRALQAGRASEALGYLGDHAQRFPSGVLEEEREAQRVVALCRADRAAEARALAARFLRERPTSPLRGRVGDACP